MQSNSSLDNGRLSSFLTTPAESYLEYFSCHHCSGGHQRRSQGTWFCPEIVGCKKSRLDSWARLASFLLWQLRSPPSLLTSLPWYQVSRIPLKELNRWARCELNKPLSFKGTQLQIFCYSNRKLTNTEGKIGQAEKKRKRRFTVLFVSWNTNPSQQDQRMARDTSMVSLNMFFPLLQRSFSFFCPNPAIHFS